MSGSRCIMGFEKDEHLFETEADMTSATSEHTPTAAPALGLASGDPTDTGHVYLCIDLKSFYASVECADLGLDPFTTNLVVADTSRGPGTICLALSPAIKACGLSGRPRLFQIPSNIRYRAIRPHMRRYMEVSAQIYGIYLRFIAKEDIHVYSVDECFIDATPYLTLYNTDGVGLARMLMDAVRAETGICATAGIGTNLFLAKVALDILAKHEESHIGILDGERFRRLIWRHRPITDIWQIGPGIARRLARYGVYDLAGVVAADEALLRREFGVNARHLIEHSRGIENCTIAQIQAYEPERHSISTGQVLARPYTTEEALTVLREMVDDALLDLVSKRLACGHVSLWVNYAWDPGEWDVATLRGGPHASISRKLVAHTCSRETLVEEIERMYAEAVDPARKVKRITLGLGDLVGEGAAELTLFTDVEAEAAERRLAQATLAVKGRFGKNALVRGRSLRSEATGIERNAQVGGHHA